MAAEGGRVELEVLPHHLEEGLPHDLVLGVSSVANVLALELEQGSKGASLDLALLRSDFQLGRIGFARLPLMLAITHLMYFAMEAELLLWISYENENYLNFGTVLWIMEQFPATRG